MATSSAAPPPYGREQHDLGPGPDGGARALRPLQAGEEQVLGAALAAIDPWAAYRSSSAGLARVLAAREDGAVRRAIVIGDRLAGIVIVRWPWLAGPYLQLLAVLPDHAGRGIGSAVLDWMAAEAPAGTRNLWLCVSAPNIRARRFYERHGFALAATLPALAADHIDELLLRKRLDALALDRDQGAGLRPGAS